MFLSFLILCLRLFEQNPQIKLHLSEFCLQANTILLSFDFVLLYLILVILLSCLQERFCRSLFFPGDVTQVWEMFF